MKRNKDFKGALSYLPSQCKCYDIYFTSCEVDDIYFPSIHFIKLNVNLRILHVFNILINYNKPH